MSKLSELIDLYCPNGVANKRLDDVFDQFSGMTGVSGKWADEGNCEFIDYMNAYTNLKIDVSSLKNATVKSAKQNALKKGDVLFTAASETPDECAIASEIEDEIKDGVFMDDHLFGLRLKEDCCELFATGFLKYVFRSASFRNQLKKVVRGATRFYISKTDFMKLSIPVPPLPVQSEFVRILDNLTELTVELIAELTAELTVREKQYKYYRDMLLERHMPAERVTLGSVCDVYDGTHQTPEYMESGVPFVSVEDIDNLRATKKFISPEAFAKFKIKPRTGDVFMTRITAGVIGKCAIVDSDDDLAYYVSLALLRPNHNILNSKYLKHYLESGIGKVELARRILWDATPTKINKADIGKVFISIPPLDVQERIVTILDRYDALCNDITEGLPAEIEARQKQYEYYRDKLLTFTPAV